jgi:hypothetical protein
MRAQQTGHRDHFSKQRILFFKGNCRNQASADEEYETTQEIAGEECQPSK